MAAFCTCRLRRERSESRASARGMGGRLRPSSGCRRNRGASRASLVLLESIQSRQRVGAESTRSDFGNTPPAQRGRIAVCRSVPNATAAGAPAMPSTYFGRHTSCPPRVGKIHPADGSQGSYAIGRNQSTPSRDHRALGGDRFLGQPPPSRFRRLATPTLPAAATARDKDDLSRFDPSHQRAEVCSRVGGTHLQHGGLHSASLTIRV